MDQNITVKIAGREFPLTATDESMESMMRFAAEEVEKSVAKYQSKMSGRPFEDIALLVALVECIKRMNAVSKYTDLVEEEKILDEELAKYLEDK